MKRSVLSLIHSSIWITTSLLPPSAAGDTATDFFERKIRPVLSENCFSCHSAEAKTLKANLLLDSLEGLLKGGDTGPAIVPGHPEKSLIIAAIRYEEPETAMPPRKSGNKLSAPQIQDFENWIKGGALWPGGGSSLSSKKFDLEQRKKDHWCWTPPASHPLPSVKLKSWPRSLTDHFILTGLESRKLTPAPEADRTALLRRLSFDITGLPPSQQETQMFLNDQSPKAVEALVDRLLASPHFGERWARHWMDLVRYADTRGHEFDHPIPNAWQYRDYLIRALNSDVPYNHFVKEHIAGDLMTPRIDSRTGANESIIATGFWFLGEEVHSPVDIRQDEVDRIDNQIDVMSKTFLGVTLACARCHDHKFDAISQKDYYAMSGFLISSGRQLARFETMEVERDVSDSVREIQTEAGNALREPLGTVLKRGIRRVANALPAARKAIIEGSIDTANEPVRDLALALKYAADTGGHSLQTVARVILGRTASKTLAPTVSIEPDPSFRILEDYTHQSPTSWMQAGSAFGPGPLQIGAMRIGSSKEQPFEGMTTQTAASRNELFSGIAHQGDNDPGSLKAFNGSGQTLRTREFTVGAGKVWILAKGAGSAYSALNSHHMIGGPLHGALFRTWKGTDHWQWVELNLANYKGHRMHLEIAPNDTGLFEVAMVAECEVAPASPPTRDKLVYESVFEGQENPPADAALLLSNALDKAADQLARNTLEQPAAELLDWMIQNWSLFGPETESERSSFFGSVSTWRAKIDSQRTRLRKESAVALAMFDGSGVEEFQLKRGSPKSPLAPVPRRLLEAVAGSEPLQIPGRSGRLELANQMTAPANPLLSRVIVNRVWQHLFGRGIVPSVDNLGVLGQPPTHPELLDTLSVEFATRQNWSLKSLIRSLVLSAAYQMSSHPSNPQAETLDPENASFHRMNIKRLEAESIRDSLLSVSGRLDPTVGGRSVTVHLTDFMEGRGRPKSGPMDGDGRRSIYVSINRNFLSPMLLAFDMPIPFSTFGRRNVSNVPAQALVLLNDPFVVAEARRWSQQFQSIGSIDERLRYMYLTAFARTPTPAETQAAKEFIARESELLGANNPDDASVWADLAHALINSKEFLYVD
jgi:hypothetical protein